MARSLWIRLFVCTVVPVEEASPQVAGAGFSAVCACGACSNSVRKPAESGPHYQGCQNRDDRTSFAARTHSPSPSLGPNRYGGRDPCRFFHAASSENSCDTIHVSKTACSRPHDHRLRPCPKDALDDFSQCADLVESRRLTAPIGVQNDSTWPLPSFPSPSAAPRSRPARRL